MYIIKTGSNNLYIHGCLKTEIKMDPSTRFPYLIFGRHVSANFPIMSVKNLNQFHILN